MDGNNGCKCGWEFLSQPPPSTRATASDVRAGGSSLAAGVQS